MPMMKNIEVEISTFVTPAEWQRLRKFFRKHAKFLGAHRDQTTYFNKGGRLRIRVEPKIAYLVFKSGDVHNPHREELEIVFSKRAVISLERLLKGIGFPVVLRWSRRREKYLWGSITVTLDDSKGYGKIFELEKMVRPGDKGGVYQELLNKFRSLDIKPLSHKEMDRRYRYYLKNWKRLIRR